MTDHLAYKLVNRLYTVIKCALTFESEHLSQKRSYSLDEPVTRCCSQGCFKAVHSDLSVWVFSVKLENANICMTLV